MLGPLSTHPHEDVLTRNPWDVLFALLCHVQVADILSLRCVCRVLRELTKARALWVERLRMLTREEIMIPTHIFCDLDDPRMDSAELERIVTAHIRAPSALLEASVLPAPSRVLENIFANPNVFAKLLPGGRFIVTGAFENPGESLASILSLWDMNAEKILVDSASFEKPLLQCTHISTYDSSAIRLAVISGTRVVGYDIDVIEMRWPTERSGLTTMHRVATLAGLPVSPRRLAIEDELICFHTRTTLIFWNWKTNALMSGVGPDDAPSHGLILRPPHVLLSNSITGHLTAFGLPTTRISQLCQTSKIQGRPSTFDTSIIHGWQPSSTTKITHFVTGSLGTTYNSSELHVYEWVQPEDQTPSTSVCPSPTLIANMTIPSAEDLHDVMVHRIAGDTFTVICSPDLDEDNKIHVRVATPNHDVASNKIALCEGMQWRRATDKLVMCPFSGTLLAVTDTSVMVFDL